MHWMRMDIHRCSTIKFEFCDISSQGDLIRTSPAHCVEAQRIIRGEFVMFASNPPTLPTDIWSLPVPAPAISRNRAQHKEEEFRRRCRIRMRFQSLRELTAPSKRDRGSVLSSAIQLIKQQRAAIEALQIQKRLLEEELGPALQQQQAASERSCTPHALRELHSLLD